MTREELHNLRDMIDADYYALSAENCDEDYDDLITLAPRIICVAPSLLDAILDQAQVEYVNGIYRGVEPWSLYDEEELWPEH